MTLAQVSCTLPLVVVMSRPQFSCHNINLMNCCFGWVSSGVVTSTSCRDINLWFCRFHLLVPDVATSISCRDIPSSNCNLQLSMSAVATSIHSHDINSCRDLTMLSRRHSLSAWLLFNYLSGTYYRDLHQVPSIFLKSRPLSRTVHTPELHQ